MSATIQKGFTYLMLLWWVAISGVLLMALSQSWHIESRRQRDIELQFRGEQIRSAIEAYASVPVSPGASRLPARLEDLLEDTRTGVRKRHLRQLWPDPVTGSPQWGLVRGPNGISGVFSTSGMTPVRAPAGIASYKEWRFTALVSTPAAASGASAPSPPASSPPSMASAPSSFSPTP